MNWDFVESVEFEGVPRKTLLRWKQDLRTNRKMKDKLVE